jgi:hypothetical protein
LVRRNGEELVVVAPFGAIAVERQFGRVQTVALHHVNINVYLYLHRLDVGE